MNRVITQQEVTSHLINNHSIYYSTEVNVAQSAINDGNSHAKGVLLSDISNKYEFHIDDQEYGGSGEGKVSPLISQVVFNPRELGILSRYQDTKLIYNELLSSTKILLTKDLTNDRVSY